MSKPICPELLGKRLWGVFNSELRPVQYVKCESPIHKPVILESKLEFKEPKAKDFDGDKVNKYAIDEAGMWPKITLEQKEKLAIGKKIIENASKKPLTSLNQKNNPTQESKSNDPWNLL